MKYRALACDYDGTLARTGVVDAATIEALQRFKASGRRLILVTGRELGDLKNVFPELGLFDRIVAENGALLYRPAQAMSVLLAHPPPTEFVNCLIKQKVAPLSVGKAIVATVHPHQAIVLKTIENLGLELHIIFNKGAVMVLPSGINKATGLKAALVDLDLVPEQIVGIGDAENDHAFLDLCGLSAAVSNALPALKERADIVTQSGHGAGVVELIELLLTNENPGH